jgi:hypothetical protein
MKEADWNQLSLRFSQQVERLPQGGKGGAEVVILFLDYLVRDSCSHEVRCALTAALAETFGSKADA